MDLTSHDLQVKADATLTQQREKLHALASRPSKAVPGDGVCPSESEVIDVATQSWDRWQRLITESMECSFNAATVESAIVQVEELLRSVPPFRAPPSPRRFMKEAHGSGLQIKALSIWVTTSDGSCDEKIKTKDQYLSIACSELNPFIIEDDLSVFQQQSSLHSFDIHSFSALILAWSYILSLKWVETLKDAGEEAYLQQSYELNEHTFWDVVIAPWQALLIHNGTTFFAPWSCNKVELATILITTSTKSSQCIKYVMEICSDPALREDCVTALFIAMKSAHSHDRSFLPLPAMSGRYRQKDHKLLYTRFIDFLERCITLSCSHEALDSVLCSVFFEPRVTCNLVKVHMTGVTAALEPIENDLRMLATVITRHSPKLGPLWKAAMWRGDFKRITSAVARGLPALNLSVASWTETLQSLVQVYYHTDKASDQIPRAQEYVDTYLIQPNASLPFTPFPPFGFTRKASLSLSIRDHLPHKHGLISYEMGFVLTDGTLFYQGAVLPLPYLDSEPPMASFSTPGTYVNQLREQPDLQSKLVEIDNEFCDATFNLFSWHRNIENGSELGNLGFHPWIFDNDSDDDSIICSGRLSTSAESV